ncbi:MAG: 5'/3'-nucleotidase SurE [Bacteroidales bacterium]|nr:5'/3'-nucleotidase SurE [Bacteroidales bacterium]
MLILVTNDDGYLSKGLSTLIRVAKNFGNVYVVAPLHGSSGLSHSITMKIPIRVKEHKTNENGVKFYICSGTPVDSVKLALNKILPRKPDLVLSGINHGSNSSISVIYSGTMAAALEASMNGIPAIGFSLLDYDEDADFTASEYYAKVIIEKIIKNKKKYPQGVALNVNIPKCSLKKIKGIKIVRIAKGVWKEEFDERVDPHNQKYYWLTGGFHNYEPDAIDTDEWVLKNNYISIVPVHADITAYFAFEYLRKLKL